MEQYLQNLPKNLPSVQFENCIGKLRTPQLHCLKLLTQKLKDNKSITKEDICEWYLNSRPAGAMKCTYYTGYKRVTPKEYYNQFSGDLYPDSLSAFQKVLGQCIIIGKLLAIPLIEI